MATTARRARTAKKTAPAAKRKAPAAKRKAPAAKKAARAVKKPAARVPAMARKTIDPGWTWDDSLPLAQARQIGNTIYVSGQVAYSTAGQLVGEGDMRAQTRQVFDNIKAVLAAAGAGIEDIIKINTYITDQSKFMDMLEVRKEIFGASLPASTAVVVAGLAFPGLLIEVEAIAIKS
jgi:reactive intermediate/imine deaminase